MLISRAHTLFTAREGNSQVRSDEHNGLQTDGERSMMVHYYSGLQPACGSGLLVW